MKLLRENTDNAENKYYPIFYIFYYPTTVIFATALLNRIQSVEGCDATKVY